MSKDKGWVDLTKTWFKKIPFPKITRGASEEE